MRLNQVTVGAIDFEESIAFYSKLGLRLIVSSHGQYARFELPDGEATFSVHLTSYVPDDGPVLYFEVEDVDATITRLRAEGISFATDPETSLGFGVRHASPILPAIDCASLTPAIIVASRLGGLSQSNFNRGQRSVRAAAVCLPCQNSDCAASQLPTQFSRVGGVRTALLPTFLKTSASKRSSHKKWRDRFTRQIVESS